MYGLLGERRKSQGYVLSAKARIGIDHEKKKQFSPRQINAKKYNNAQAGYRRILKK
jgi:hypothetical protein